MKLEIGKEYNLNNLKEIKATKDFLTLDEYVIGCQNRESINECRSRQYIDTLLKTCGCLPFGLIDLDQVKKKPEIFTIQLHFFQELCHNQEQKRCIKNNSVDYLDCLPQCEGIDVISYNEIKILDNEDWMQQISQLTRLNLKTTYENDPEFKRIILKLSHQYKQYKDTNQLKLESKKCLIFID